ncbi:MAG: ComEC/Rec2 family competence protein [Patescibacteria group bacterium]
MKSKRNKLVVWLSGTVCAGLLLACLYCHDQYKTDLRVVFFDVGQGDAALIRTPSHQNILIDAGPDTTVLSELGQVLPFYDRHIDLVLLTHCHADHEGGLAAVLERYGVGQVIWSGVGDGSPGCLAWQDAAQRKNIPVNIVFAGKKYSFGTVTMDILYPISYDSVAGAKDLNETSVVSRLVYQNVSFLFTGDAPQDVEKIVLQQRIDIGSDVLKVGHHGSRYSSSPEFLQAVYPEYAVVSVGAGNSYGHPHLSTMKRLEHIGSMILRTDVGGDIVMVSDGNTISTE